MGFTLGHIKGMGKRINPFCKRKNKQTSFEVKYE